MSSSTAGARRSEGDGTRQRQNFTRSGHKALDQSGIIGYIVAGDLENEKRLQGYIGSDETTTSHILLPVLVVLVVVWFRFRRWEVSAGVA
ncbi:MAG: hypothetical protein D6681_22355 [Calditrichaeota bacterium]|nr:MAG: hypothetical protein D6681_22355 [Calditrichota bacterium]